MSDAAPSVRVAHLCRHPVKAIGFEEIDRATLSPGAAFPHDRRWAVAHAAAGLPAALPEWVGKSHFLRGAAGAELMAVRARFDPPAGRLELVHPRAGSITVAPDTAEGAAVLVDWLRPLWPAGRPDPERVVSRSDGALTDRPEPFLSILNHASNRALGQRLGQGLSIHRWRGNIWLDGLAPWEEFDLIGREIVIGGARLRVEQAITRCKATTANPETGRTDTDTLGALDEARGARDFGVYARVLDAGEIGVGDAARLS